MKYRENNDPDFSIFAGLFSFIFFPFFFIIMFVIFNDVLISINNV